MSTPMFEMPAHMSMPINALGQGPETDDDAIAGTICWCMSPLCTRYRTGVGESMNRIPPAAKQLAAEVAACDSEVNVIASGEADGYGVHRSLTFTQAPWLGDALEAVDDERILSYVRENAHTVLVTFVGDTRADATFDFDIDAVYEVLAGDEGDAEPDQEPGDQDQGDEEDDDAEGEPPEARE